jgi:hypothetical protein
MSENLYTLFGEYMIVQTTEKPWECFVMFDCGQPVFSTRMSEGMIFAYKESAEQIAGQLGTEWHVIDVSKKSLQDAKKLLKAIFREDDEECPEEVLMKQ